MKHTIVHYGPDTYETVEDTALDALANARNVVIDLDEVRSLGVEDVRRLTKLLHLSRNLGSEFALRTSRPEVRKALEITALDRLFTVIEEDVA